MLMQYDWGWRKKEKEEMYNVHILQARFLPDLLDRELQQLW